MIDVTADRPGAIRAGARVHHVSSYRRQRDEYWQGFVHLIGNDAIGRTIYFVKWDDSYAVEKCWREEIELA